jgi:hypothetical protein
VVEIGMSVTPWWLDGVMFDLGAQLDDLRCRPTGWLRARRDALVREQRRLRVEELAVTRVLDERGAIDESVAARDGVSERTVRETVETARALESLPAVAAAAWAGALSPEQLGPVAQLADAASDVEWARRGPRVAPVDLARMARTQRTPTMDEARARRQARSLRMWWQPERGMLSIRGELADLDGARFEATINRMIDRMRPTKGAAWDSREHRGADALVELCERFEHVESPTLRVKPLLVVQVPLEGPAQVAGVALPDAMVDALRANADIEAVLVDDHHAPVTVGARSAGLSPKVIRAILLRDGHCRVGTCDRRDGLQIHHLVPRSHGGTDDFSNLAAVCAGGATNHHQMLIPHGPWTLTGNPNQPDGLRLIRRDHPTDHDHPHHHDHHDPGDHDARAGPHAA